MLRAPLTSPSRTQSKVFAAWLVATLAMGSCNWLRPESQQRNIGSSLSRALEPAETTTTPLLRIYPKRITENARHVVAQAASKGVAVAAVVKGASAHPAVVAALMDAGIGMIADSRVINITRIRKAGFKGDVLLMRPASRSEARQVVLHANYSLVSNFDVARFLSDAAAKENLTHNVIVMIEAGDLREGVDPPSDAVDLARRIAELPNLRLAGLGANFACNAGVLPDGKNTASLVDLGASIREALCKELELISAGNSSGLPLLRACGLPHGINHYRIGESILLGTNAIDGTPWTGTRQDAFVFIAEVIESYKKPSRPWGEVAGNAFGERLEYKDQGLRTRLILNAGRQDVDQTGLTPQDTCMKIVNSSSDHLILDVEDCSAKPSVGDHIEFRPNYAALLRATTSEYVAKQIAFDD